MKSQITYLHDQIREESTNKNTNIEVDSEKSFFQNIRKSKLNTKTYQELDQKLKRPVNNTDSKEFDSKINNYEFLQSTPNETCPTKISNYNNNCNYSFPVLKAKFNEDIKKRISKFIENIKLLEELLVIGDENILSISSNSNKLLLSRETNDKIKSMDLDSRKNLFDQTIKEVEDELIRKTLDKSVFNIILDWNLYSPIMRFSNYNIKTYSPKVLKLYKTLCSNNTHLTTYLSSNSIFIGSILTTMLNLNCLDPGIKLLEELIIFSQVNIDTSLHIYQIRDIFKTFSYSQSDNLTRLIAIFLYDKFPEGFSQSVNKTISINNHFKNCNTVYALTNIINFLIHNLFNKFKNIRSLAELSFKDYLFNTNSGINAVSSGVNNNNNLINNNTNSINQMNHVNNPNNSPELLQINSQEALEILSMDNSGFNNDIDEIEEIEIENNNFGVNNSINNNDDVQLIGNQENFPQQPGSNNNIHNTGNNSFNTNFNNNNTNNNSSNNNNNNIDNSFTNINTNSNNNANSNNSGIDFSPYLHTLQNISNNMNGNSNNQVNLNTVIDNLRTYLSNTKINDIKLSSSFTIGKETPNEKSKILNAIQNINVINTFNIDIYGYFKTEQKKEMLKVNALNSFEPDWEILNLIKQETINEKMKKVSNLLKTITIKEVFRGRFLQLANILKLTSTQVEIMFIMTALLSSNKNAEIQNTFFKKETLNEIIEYFECIEWGNIYNNNDRSQFNIENLALINQSNPMELHAYHSIAGCKCEKESSIKTQYLRLIYFLLLRDFDNFDLKFDTLTEQDLQHTLLNNSYFTFFLSHFYEKANNPFLKNLTLSSNYSILAEKLFSFQPSIIYKDSLPKKNKMLTLLSLGFFANDKNSIQTVINNNTNTQNHNYNNNSSPDTGNPFILDDKLSQVLEHLDSKRKIDFMDIELVNLELNLKRLNNSKDNIFNCPLIQTITKNTDKCGLLNFLIIRYLLECPYSPSKYWMATCLEIFIRGESNFFQFYILNSGLIVNLLYDILYTSEVVSNIDYINGSSQFLQMTFDLLAQIVKFNKLALFKLNYYFSNNKKERDLFFNKIVAKKHLVDSNVFIRTIIITLNAITLEMEINKFNSLYSKQFDIKPVIINEFEEFKQMSQTQGNSGISFENHFETLLQFNLSKKNCLAYHESLSYGIDNEDDYNRVLLSNNFKSSFQDHCLFFGYFYGNSKYLRKSNDVLKSRENKEKSNNNESIINNINNNDNLKKPDNGGNMPKENYAGKKEKKSTETDKNTCLSDTDKDFNTKKRTSVPKIINTEDKNHIDNYHDECFETDDANLVRLFIKLIDPEVISIENACQTNISCLNTALIILIIQSTIYFEKYILTKIKIEEFIRTKKPIKTKEDIIKLNELLVNYINTNFIDYLNNSKLIRFLNKVNRTMRMVEINRYNIIWANFYDLLKIWKNYYNNISKDTMSLVFATKIDINTWRSVVDLLLEENHKKTSIMNFLNK